MTAAGAERIVRLTAVSQTESQELSVFEIPIQVIALREVQVNIESTLGILRPDSTSPSVSPWSTTATLTLI